MNTFFRFISLIVLTISVYPQEAYICIWRNPERTMTKIFPEASDYKTITIDISKELRAVIEERLGSPLLPGQREQYQYYELTGKAGQTLGYIIAASQKGEYGAIEFVFGLSKEYKIADVYIQRAREKDKEFKTREFLDQFKSLGVSDEQELLKHIKFEKSSASEAVVLGFKKELIVFDELLIKKK